LKILGISVKQVVIGIEFTPEDLLYLKWVLDNSIINYNGDNEFEEEAQKYVTKELYPTLVDLLKELENAPG